MSEPKVATFPAIRGALKFYQIASIITGIMLLLLILEMVARYTPIHLELFSGGSGGFLWLASVTPVDCQWYSLLLPGSDSCDMVSNGDGVNLSTLILIAHGWFYVVYLFSIFRLWSLMRWRFGRFIVLALGGVVPLLSFFMEAKTSREVRAYLLQREAASDTDSAPNQEVAR